MKKKLLITFIALASILNASAATIVPTTSTPGNDVWYMIRVNPRDAANTLRQWLSVDADGRMNYSTLTGDDTQYWKVVDNGTGVALVNKAGKYLDTDLRARTRLTVLNSAPTTPLRIVPASGYPGRYFNTSTTIDVAPLGVFIVDNTASTTVAANNTITYTSTPETSFALTIYSPASGDILVTTNPTWGGGNTNQIVIFRTPAEVVADNKEMLQSTITSITAAYNNSAEGLNPGQVSKDDRINLKDALDDAQLVCDDVNSTIQNYIDKVTELNSVFGMFRSQVILPAVSTTTDNWYYIQGTRPTNTYLTAPAAGAGTGIKDLTVVPNDFQLWKLVPNGSGFAMQNKATSEYIQTDVATGANLISQVAMPTKPLRFITSAETTNKAYRFWIENTSDASAQPFRLHAANGNNVMNWTGGANDNCTWLFLSADELFRVQFANAITNARAVYTTSTEGVEFGQYSAATRSAFNDLITAEEAKDVATMTQDDLKAAAKLLNDAASAYECNGDVSTLSSVTKIKWFRLINAMQPSTGYAAGKAMTSTGRTADYVGDGSGTDLYKGKFTYLAKDVNTDDQLFRFEMNVDGTKATTIINKGNGKYVASNGAIVSTPTVDNEFAITRLDNQSFWIKPTSADPLHAASFNTEIVNWNSAAGTASAWRFEYVKSEDVTDFTAAYLAKRTQARATYDIAALVGGTQFGQYSAASVAAFGTVLTTEESKDAATLTQAQMLQGINDLGTASAGLVVNTDVKLLTSTTPGQAKWFRVINNQSGTGYASNMAMSSNGRIATEHFTYEAKDVNSDAQLFRFELTADQTQVANIINKANNLFVTADGIMATASTVGNNFDITQLTGGRSFWIDPTNTVSPDPTDEYLQTAPLHAAAAGTSVVNWLSGAGSASAWIFEYVKEESTSVKNVEAFSYRVRTNNNIITVDGVENFEVYSVLGQKQNIKKALTGGVYFVKVNNAVKKVVID